jgi:hypothetical protein
MIRNVVVGRLRDGVTPQEIEPALQALRDLKVEGVAFTLVAGVDRGLRDGNASYGLTCDLVDDDAYRIYDADPEHNRIRREMFAPLSVTVERVQFRLPYAANTIARRCRYSASVPRRASLRRCPKPEIGPTAVLTRLPTTPDTSAVIVTRQRSSPSGVMVSV